MSDCLANIQNGKACFYLFAVVHGHITMIYIFARNLCLFLAKNKKALVNSHVVHLMTVDCLTTATKKY